MASHEPLLKAALSKYTYPDIAKRDILTAFQNFKDLGPAKDAFVFNDGNRKELLCLQGTVPVSYKGASYNIPVCLWLTETHPYNPPMVYVRPTQDMQMKIGPNLDETGKVYLPYLHEWKHPQSDLVGLIQILIIVWSDNPPVFSRPKPARPAYGPGQAPGAQPPYPMAQGSSVHGNRHGSYPAGNATQSAPYPAAGGFGMPMPNTNASTNQYPGYPPQQPAGYSSSPHYGTGSGYTAPSGGYTPSSYPSQSYGAPSYPSQGPGQGYQQPGTNLSYPTPQHTPYPAVTTAAAITATTEHKAVTNQQSLSDDQIRMSLLSAVEDKMKRRLKEIFAQAQAEMDSLNKTQTDLKNGKSKLTDLLAKLEKEQFEADKNIQMLKDKNEEIRTAIGKMESQDEVVIDDAVVTTAPLYKQILNAFAEEQAIEDAIYYMGEALRKGVLDLDVFLKQVRELSRKQFMLRALMTKCRQKAGLS